MPIVLTGKAEGVKLGGIMHQVIRVLQISCTPDKIPVKLEVDVTSLGMNEAIHVSDLKLGEGVRPLPDPGSTVCAVTAPKAEKEAAPAAAAEGAVPAEGAAAAPAAAGAAAPGKARRRGSSGGRRRQEGRRRAGQGRRQEVRRPSATSRRLRCGSSLVLEIRARSTSDTRHNIGFMVVDELGSSLEAGAKLATKVRR